MVIWNIIENCHTTIGHHPHSYYSQFLFNIIMMYFYFHNSLEMYIKDQDNIATLKNEDILQYDQIPFFVLNVTF